MKDKYLEAIEDLINEYDAYYIMNKYGELLSEECTHYEQFKLLKEFVKDDEIGNNALKSIRYNYDCYYKEEVSSNKDTAFSYLKEFIENNITE